MKILKFNIGANSVDLASEHEGNFSVAVILTRSIKQ